MYSEIDDRFDLLLDSLSQRLDKDREDMSKKTGDLQAVVEKKNRETLERLLNPHRDPVSIKQDTILGQAEQSDLKPRMLVNEESSDRHNFSGVRRVPVGPKPTATPPGPGPTRNVKGPASAPRVPDHLLELFERTVEGKDGATTDAMQRHLVEYQDTFSRDEYDLGVTNLAEHVINTGDAAPIRQPPRWTPMAYEGEDHKSLDKLQKQRSIRPSNCPWASLIVLVRKKDGSVRPCVDYHRLNNVTEKDAFPLPRTEDCLDAVAGAVWFSTVDVTSAYNQIPVRPQHVPKMAFMTKYGLFEYTTMPFGLCNAPATFQRVMEMALQSLAVDSQRATSCI